MIPYFKSFIDNREINAVKKVMKSGWFTHGHVTRQAEQEIRELEGAGYCLLVNSNTSGMILALEALNMGPDDSVIVCPYTYRSTVQACITTGAEVIYADTYQDGFNIDPACISALIKSNTKAIVVTHMGGLLCDMKAILAYGVPVIEDCAHILPLGRKDKGTFRVYSFYANKLICAGGDGGAICFDDGDYYPDLYRKRYHGRADYEGEPKALKYKEKDGWQHITFEDLNNGHKFNTTDISSAILLEQLKKIPEIIKHRTELHEAYKQNLPVGVYFIPPLKNNHLHLFILLFNTVLDRNEFKQFCEGRGIGTSWHFPIMYGADECPNAVSLSRRCISLPMYQGLTVGMIKRMFK
jgi:perosamine synthetase